jgi:3-(3-hydroxy-phenyl)propionate hydroxylase
MHSIANKRNLEAREPAEQDRFRDEMRAIAADRNRAHAYLERVSMITSLKRAAELG